MLAQGGKGSQCLCNQAIKRLKPSLLALPLLSCQKFCSKHFAPLGAEQVLPG